jgi:hypothetical protein
LIELRVAAQHARYQLSLPTASRINIASVTELPSSPNGSGNQEFADTRQGSADQCVIATKGHL